MPKSRAEEYVEKLADELVRLTPYALKRTGLVQSQVFVKIEDYSLICAPYQLSMKQGIFLVVLSPQEIRFFQRYEKKLCSIDLTFQKTGSKKPLSMLLRGRLERIGAVKGKKNVCMLDASIKGCPNELVEIIGDYITAFDGLKNQFESFKDRVIVVEETAAKLMRFNYYAEIVLNGASTRASLKSLSVNKLTINLPRVPPGLAEGQPCQVKLYFQVYQFAANGKVTSLTQVQGGWTAVTVEIGFTPELIEIVDDYFFRRGVLGRAAAPAPTA